jgi:hypothetical protein
MLWQLWWWWRWFVRVLVFGGPEAQLKRRRGAELHDKGKLHFMLPTCAMRALWHTAKGR